MNRKIFFGLVLIASLAALQTAAWAGSITLVNGTAAGSLTSGDKTFSNFYCQITTLDPIATPTSCGNITVSSYVDPVTGNVGIQYGGSFTASTFGDGGQVDVRLTYDVSAPAPTITDVHMDFDGHLVGATPTDVMLADITETVFGTNPAAGQVGQITVSATNPPPVIVQSASADLTGGPYQSLHVSKDVLLQAFDGSNPTGSLTNHEVVFTTLNQTFSQIPEPGSIVLLGSALMGCVALVRRRVRKQA